MPFGINETMGQYSELFMLLAAGTYTVAFIAFAWDLAKSSKALRAVDLKAAQAGVAAKVPAVAGVGAGSAGARMDGPADRAELSFAGKLAGADCFLAWWPPRGRLHWIHESEWPGSSSGRPGRKVSESVESL